MRAVLLLFAVHLAWGQSAVSQLLEEKTLLRIRALDESLDGVLGVAAVDLGAGHVLSYHGDAVFPQASSIKIAIMVQMFRAERAGQFHFSDKVTLTDKDAAGGSGDLQNELKKGPVTVTVAVLVRAMIEKSDNTATNACIRMTGMETVNRTLHELGFSFTRLRRMLMDSAAAGRDEENVSTPLEMVRLVELIYRGKVVDEQASREMLGILKLAKGGMREGVPNGIEVAAKSGDLPGVFCETGIVFHSARPFALSVMSTFVGTDRNPVPAVTKIVYEHFDRLARSNSYGNRLR